MGYQEPPRRREQRERLARQNEPKPDPERWTLTACNNLCALMSDKRDPLDYELHEPIRAVTVRRGGTSFILTATQDGWRSHPIHPDLEVPLDMTVRLARRLRALLPDDEDTAGADISTAELVRRYKDGQSARQIADDVNRSPDDIRDRLKAAGVTIRPPGPPPKPPNDT